MTNQLDPDTLSAMQYIYEALEKLEGATLKLAEACGPEVYSEVSQNNQISRELHGLRNVDLRIWPARRG